LGWFVIGDRRFSALPPIRPFDALVALRADSVFSQGVATSPAQPLLGVGNDLLD
jgi:hypothetical protein